MLDGGHFVWRRDWQFGVRGARPGVDGQQHAEAPEIESLIDSVDVQHQFAASRAAII